MPLQAPREEGGEHFDPARIIWPVGASGAFAPALTMHGRSATTNLYLWRLRLEVENRLPVGGGTNDQLMIGVGLVLGGGGFDLPDAAVMLLSR